MGSICVSSLTPGAENQVGEQLCRGLGVGVEGLESGESEARDNVGLGLLGSR